MKTAACLLIGISLPATLNAQALGARRTSPATVPAALAPSPGTEAPAKDATPPEAEREELDEETLRRYRAAVVVLGSSTATDDLVRAAGVLEEEFPRSRPVVLEAVRSPSSRARTFGLKILGEQGGGEDDVRVVARALTDNDVSVRLAAVMALQRLGPSGYPAMAAYLPGETRPNNRKMAVKTFERWGDQNAIPLLVGLLRKEKHDGVRNFMVTALERLSGRRLGDDIEAWDEYLLEFVPPEQKLRQRESLLRVLESRGRSEKSDGESGDLDEDLSWR